MATANPTCRQTGFRGISPLECYLSATDVTGLGVAVYGAFHRRLEGAEIVRGPLSATGTEILSLLLYQIIKEPETEPKDLGSGNQFCIFARVANTVHRNSPRKYDLAPSDFGTARYPSRIRLANASTAGWLEHGGSSGPVFGLGWRLERPQAKGIALEVRFESFRLDSENDDREPEHGIGLRMTAHTVGQAVSKVHLFKKPRSSSRNGERGLSL